MKKLIVALLVIGNQSVWAQAAAAPEVQPQISIPNLNNLPQLPPLQLPQAPVVQLPELPNIPMPVKIEKIVMPGQDLKTIAQNSLAYNIVKLDAGLFLSAGAHQFKSFWTRDFCFASRGLLAMGRADVVKSHLTYLLDNRRADDLVPLYVDSVTPVNRVISDTLFRATRQDYILPMTNEIKPFYLVNNEYEAIDSNIMVLYAALSYYKATNDTEWFNKYQPTFKKIFDFYNQKKDSDGLILQVAHADWQDSAAREGKTFFTNLLYYHMASEYKFMSDNELLTLKNKIVEVFYASGPGLFRSMAGRENISLEGNLWAIEFGLIANKDVLYRNLTKHQLFKNNQGPGFATYPSYTLDDTYIQVKVVGLQEYHGNIYWSWLMAYSAKIAYQMKDMKTFNTVYGNLKKVALRDHSVVEIYNNDKNLTMFSSPLYTAESPFSWGSGFTVDLEKTLNH